MSAFQHFYNASGLAIHNVATQQGYLLQAVDVELRKIIETKITATMKITGPGAFFREGGMCDVDTPETSGETTIQNISSTPSTSSLERESTFMHG